MNSTDRPVSATQIDETHGERGAGRPHPNDQGNERGMTRQDPKDWQAITNGDSRGQPLATDAVRTAGQKVWPKRAPDTAYQQFRLFAGIHSRPFNVVCALSL
jgi:hypothetical protein